MELNFFKTLFFIWNPNLFKLFESKDKDKRRKTMEEIMMSYTLEAEEKEQHKK